MQQLFVGTYTGGTSKGIHILTFDDSSQQYSEYQCIPCDHPSYLAFNRQGNMLYAANELGADRSGTVSAYRLEEGRWVLADQGASEGADPCHLLLTPNERYLIVSNYSGGSLAVYELGLDSGIKAPVQLLSYGGGSQARPEQEASHIHSSIVSPDGEYLFVFDLGNDALYRYFFDEIVLPNEKAPLDISSKKTIELKVGSGPRMGRFSHNGRFFYVLSELDGCIEVFAYEKGELTSIQRVSLVDPDRETGDVRQSGAELVFSRDGHYLMASNRGSQNELVSYQVNHQSGELEHQSFISTEGSIPRHFTQALDDGFIVANQGSGSLVSFARTEDNSLTSIGKVGEIDQPAFVCFHETSDD